MIEKKKELLFRVSASDCDWNYQRGRGNGGQKKQKTSSAVICTHRSSGAQGYAEDTRSQAQNRAIAFKRMAETKEFKTWHKLETMRRLGQLREIDEKVDLEMHRIKVEGVDDQGRWTEEAVKQ